MRAGLKLDQLYVAITRLWERTPLNAPWPAYERKPETFCVGVEGAAHYEQGKQPIELHQPGLSKDYLDALKPIVLDDDAASDYGTSDEVFIGENEID